MIARNRRARFDFDLGDRFEAGLVLTGSEVKSLRQGKASLAGSWIRIDDAGEAWLVGAHIPEYAQAGYAGHDPTRRRKLLLHRRELERLAHEVSAAGVTLVPLTLYFRDGLAKLEFAIGRGRAKHDKRRALAERDAERHIERAARRRR